MLMEEFNRIQERDFIIWNRQWHRSLAAMPEMTNEVAVLEQQLYSHCVSMQFCLAAKRQTHETTIRPPRA
jgi:hypothetical protein